MFGAGVRAQASSCSAKGLLWGSPPFARPRARGLCNLCGESGGVHKVELPADYDAQPWSDPVTDPTAAVCDAVRHLAEAVSLPPAALPPGERDLGGVVARVEGAGPPLVLVPSSFWPRQWDAAVTELARSFTAIRLGGPNVGNVAMLEQRAADPGYAQMVDLLFDRLAIAGGDRILEVGPGSGALVRKLGRPQRALSPKRRWTDRLALLASL